MKKFTSINESKDLGKFIMTDNEFNNYKNYITRLLQDMYKDNLIKVDNLKLIGATPYEKKVGREFSVLNKVNTNVLLLKKLVNNFDFKNTNDLINFVSVNKNDLFTDNGKYFKNLVFSTIRYTEKKGEENEEITCDYIKNIIKSKFNQNITPIREVTSSYKDLILGIDITFTINGKEYTCQVKPFNSVEDSGEHLIITSSGSLKKYKTDYIAFSSKDKNVVMLFRNKEFSINRNEVTMYKKDLVTL